MAVSASSPISWGHIIRRLWLSGNGVGLRPAYMPIIIMVGLVFPNSGSKIACTLSPYRVLGEILLNILYKVSN